MKNNKILFRIVSGLVLFFCVINADAQNWDINLLRNINEHRSTATESAMIKITNSAAVFSIGTPIIIYTVGLIEKDSTTKRKAIFIAESLVASTFISFALKNSIKRERPFETYPEIESSVDESGYSFPSNHTSAAFATATSLSMAYPKWYVIAPSFLYAGAVGYSRLYLGVHYPSDVVAGALIGSGSAFLCYKLNKWINKKRKPSQKKLWE